MKRSSHRPEQVAETIRQVLAEALAREVRDPRIGRVTITSVQVTNDLSHAKVMVVVGGEEEDKAKALEGLVSAGGFLRGRVAGALSTRTTPALAFELDRGAEHAQRIESLLASLRRGEEA
jgi:ribosome-binding factor A